LYKQTGFYAVFMRYLRITGLLPVVAVAAFTRADTLKVSSPAFTNAVKIPAKYFFDLIIK
jgi:hypothetical protein